MIELRRVGACFTLASLLEVSICPSPGLVSPVDNGAHTDMSMLTFLVGSSVLAPFYSSFVELGYRGHHKEPSHLFDELRQLGREAEQELLRATAGVNTQRGQLFLLGLAAGITGMCLARGEPVPSQQFYERVRLACSGLSSRELGAIQPESARTAGERLYLAHGTLGIRGEAEQGFPTVESVAYPTLRRGLERGLSLNDAAVETLLAIMAVISDTTVLGRRGEEGLSMVHRRAQEALDLGGVYTASGRASIYQSHELFCRERLSPGGAADLLALAMALFFVERDYPTQKQIMTPSLFKR